MHPMPGSASSSAARRAARAKQSTGTAEAKAGLAHLVVPDELRRAEDDQEQHQDLVAALHQDMLPHAPVDDGLGASVRRLQQQVWRGELRCQRCTDTSADISQKKRTTCEHLMEERKSTACKIIWEVESRGALQTRIEPKCEAHQGQPGHP